MKLYVGFDDTDTLDCGRGTGKLARWFTDVLPEECSSWGVVRQQLFHSDEIPMTSHNSSLTVVLDVPDGSYTKRIISLAAQHIKNFFEEGSDPGLCVIEGGSAILEQLADFGERCTCEKVSMDDAYKAVGVAHLSGHGGTNLGVIGAAAGVGLTYRGDSGRFVEYLDTRYLPDLTSVQSLSDRGIKVMSVNRHAEIPKPCDKVFNHGSLRPRLLFGRIVVPVISSGPGMWKTINEKAEY